MFCKAIASEKYLPQVMLVVFALGFLFMAFMEPRYYVLPFALFILLRKPLAERVELRTLLLLFVASMILLIGSGLGVIFV